MTIFDHKFVLNNKFKRKYNIPLLDCIIAATASCIDAELLTRNEKDFSKIEEIKLFKGSKI